MRDPDLGAGRFLCQGPAHGQLPDREGPGGRPGGLLRQARRARPWDDEEGRPRARVPDRRVPDDARGARLDRPVHLLHKVRSLQLGLPDELYGLALPGAAGAGAGLQVPQRPEGRGRRREGGEGRRGARRLEVPLCRDVLRGLSEGGRPGAGNTAAEATRDGRKVSQEEGGSVPEPEQGTSSEGGRAGLTLSALCSGRPCTRTPPS